jgi:hypothetical protein
MLQKLLNIPVVAEMICFIAALLLLPKRTTVWQLFKLSLLLTICIETIGWYLKNKLGIYDNGWLFNFNLFINVCFSIWMIAQAGPLRKFKKSLYEVIFLFLLFALINLFFFEGLKVYNSKTEVFSDILFIIISCYFFYALLTEVNYRNVFRYEYFWYANGLLFYSLGAVVLYLYYSYIKSQYLYALAHYSEAEAKSIIDQSSRVFQRINGALNIILYGSFLIAFICRNRNTKS